MVRSWVSGRMAPWLVIALLMTGAVLLGSGAAVAARIVGQTENEVIHACVSATGAMSWYGRPLLRFTAAPTPSPIK